MTIHGASRYRLAALVAALIALDAASAGASVTNRNPADSTLAAAIGDSGTTSPRPFDEIRTMILKTMTFDDRADGPSFLVAPGPPGSVTSGDLIGDPS